MPDYNLIRLANERMSITWACREVGVEIPDFSIASLKTYCPWGHLTHADGGLSKALRVYPASNSAWCFDCREFFTPTKLIAKDRDISEEQAAEWILEVTGYVSPDYKSRWDAVTSDKIAIDTDALAEALKIACARFDPDWEERQFEDEVSVKLRQCLSLLSKVRNQEDADKWLRVTKLAMQEVLAP